MAGKRKVRQARAPRRPERGGAGAPARAAAEEYAADVAAALGPGGYEALLRSHCQLVEQVTHLAAAVVALWDENEVLREAVGLRYAPPPVASSLALVAGRGVNG